MRYIMLMFCLWLAMVYDYTEYFFYKIKNFFVLKLTDPVHLKCKVPGMYDKDCRACELYTYCKELNDPDICRFVFKLRNITNSKVSK